MIFLTVMGLVLLALLWIGAAYSVGSCLDELTDSLFWTFFGVMLTLALPIAVAMQLQVIYQ